MHISDVALECARECLRAAADSSDPKQLRRLASIGQRLIEALTEDAKICAVSSVASASDDTGLQEG